MIKHPRRYILESEKKTSAPIFLDLTNQRKSILMRFIETLPIPIPTISLLVSSIDTPAMP
jgi:hypothetical protein